MSDLLFDIGPSDGQLRVVLHGAGLPPAGFPLQRPRFSVSPADLDQLRRGDAPPALVNQVADKVSQWLLDAGLQMLLLTRLGEEGADGLRLVFVINDPLLVPLVTDIPLELLTLPGSPIPLVLQNRVDSLIYVLPYTGIKPTAPTSGNWPLKVLIVRANPLDLGGLVPAAAPLREGILALRPDLSAEHLQIDILSREPAEGVIGPPTPEMLVDVLDSTSYDILLYLGHGDLQQSFQDLPPVGALQLESPPGTLPSPLFSHQLAQILHRRPVPVVLLVGCLTGATVPEALQEALPQWMRGSKGVAEALVNSESGVQFTVGMRYRVDAQVAQRFVEALFRSLLKDQPGNVEAAVHAARAKLHALSHHPLAWCAPVVFRTPASQEPLFPFLGSGASCPIIPGMQEERALAWDALAKLNWSLRPPGLSTPMHQWLDQRERILVETHVAQEATLLMPGRLELHPSDTSATLPIALHRPVTVRTLEGTLAVGTNIRVQALRPSQALKDAGYRLFTSLDEEPAAFILSPTRRRPDPLPEGPLMEVELTLQPTIQSVYPVTVGITRTEPKRLICPGSNAVIVAAE